MKKRRKSRKSKLLASTSDPTAIRLRHNSRQVAERVRRLTEAGHNGDEVAALVGVGKNELRRKHALDLRAGRQKRAAEAEIAESEKLSTDEETMRRAIFAGHGRTDWEHGGINDLNGRTLKQTKQLWSEWLKRARGGNRILPMLLANEMGLPS